MPHERERTTRERETLIFATPEEAKEWQERIEGRLDAEQPIDLQRKRQVIAQEVARQFEAQGEAVGIVRQPWEHTVAEHEEAQRLVDLAFAKDLPAAIRTARGSGHYPRNLDLFHDVLTGEMYQLVRHHKLSRQPVVEWIVVSVVVVVIAGALVWLLIRYS